MRLISMPPGIGDSCWILQKLVNANEKFIFRIPGANPQRGKALFDLLPQVSESAYYDNFRFREVKFKNNAANEVFWKDITGKEIFLEANSHVEAGKRIEGFLPDLPTSFKLDFITTKKDDLSANLLLDQSIEHFPVKKIGIYCASYSGSNNWGTWLLPEWLKLIELLNAHEKTTFVIIGAPYDDLTQDLYRTLLEKNISAINTVGQELGTTIEILKRLDFFIGFPSGLSILNELIGKDGIMFYSKAIKLIINTWADPIRIVKGNIKECVFCDPEQIFEWYKNK